jgi:hypothetical protein
MVVVISGLSVVVAIVTGGAVVTVIVVDEVLVELVDAVVKKTVVVAVCEI